jgi:hypothetical protein
MTNMYKILIKQPEEERQHGRPRRRWENSIEVELKETGRESVDGIHVAHMVQWWVLVKTVMNI